MAQKRNRHPASAVLLYLAKNGLTSQQSLAEVVPYRTVIRVLKQLQKSGLVKLEGRGLRDDKLVGAPQNWWGLTFFGVATAFNWVTEGYDQIAEKHTDLSPVFKLWSYIKRDELTRELVIAHIKIFNSLTGKQLSFDSKLEKLASMISISEPIGFIDRFHWDFIKTALLFEYSLGVAIGVNLPPKNRPKSFAVFEYLFKNPDYRILYNRFIMEEEDRIRCLEAMKKHFNL
jgi:hypothetical protein